MGTVKDPVIVGGLTFNDPDAFYRVCDVMEGWEDTSPLDYTLVPNGNGPGAVMATRPVPKEQAITLGGAWVTASRDDADVAADQLKALFPVGQEIAVERRGRIRYLWLVGPVSTDLVTPRGFRWEVQALALDPFLYGGQVESSAGVSTGDTINRTYGPGYTRTYPSGNARTYITVGVSGVRVTSPGTAESARLVFTITGPLTAGEWRIVNDATGETQYVDITFTEGQTLTIDEGRQLAFLGRQDVTSLVFGDWLTVAPGDNVFRLFADTPDPLVSMTVKASPAWR